MNKKRKRTGAPNFALHMRAPKGTPSVTSGSHGTSTTVHYYSKKKGRKPQLPVAHARTRGKLFDVT